MPGGMPPGAGGMPGAGAPPGAGSGPTVEEVDLYVLLNNTNNRKSADFFFKTGNAG